MDPDRTRRILEIIDEAAGAAAGALVGEILGVRKRFAAGELTVENVQAYIDPALNLAFGNEPALRFVNEIESAIFMLNEPALSQRILAIMDEAATLAAKLRG